MLSLAANRRPRNGRHGAHAQLRAGVTTKLALSLLFPQLRMRSSPDACTQPLGARIPAVCIAVQYSAKRDARTRALPETQWDGLPIACAAAAPTWVEDREEWQRWSASSGASRADCAVREGGERGGVGVGGSRRACALTPTGKTVKIHIFYLTKCPKPRRLNPVPKPQPCQRAQRSTLIMSAAALMSLPMARLLKSTPRSDILE